ncbi:amidohydrolase family protein [Lysobacter arenosi]|uniref:Amidohydrolase family protein n=1 Tax=Lysobacter arenosi TaxID=2795387 RepID=A0ABX7R9R4_9GAMM|nr:amidohydrolase family protein [Lysobacter arenosi]QSX74730.1 amidohydrolase family protein [Lysobacter arenosi]
MTHLTIKALAAALALTLAGASVAATPDVVVVRAGHLVDVDHGRVLGDQAIRIEGERITRVEPWSATVAGDARVLDWSGYTVLPGLIDLHTHLVGDIQSDNVAAPLMSTSARDALVGVRNARDTLRAGFTTVRDVGTYRAFTDVALRNAINEGIVEGPRMLVAGTYITVSGGGGEVTGLAPDVQVPADMRRGVANSEAEIRQRVRELIAGGADFIKLIATGAVLASGTEPGAPEYSEAEIRAAVEEAALHGTFVVAHAHGAEGIKRAVRVGVRSIEHGSYLDDEGIALMKKHGTWLVADVYNGDYIEEIGRRDGWPEEILRKNTETTQTQREGFAKAVKAGVRIGFGTDSGVYPHGQNARQFAYMVRNGQTPMQAISSATISAAKSLGRDAEFGSVAAGKSADLIAVQGDPLADVEVLRRVEAVIAQGRLVCAAPENRCTGSH